MDGQRIPRLSLDLLRSFRAAARHLSFTRAAQDLFVTQSAISRGISKLEEQLGKPLFRRVNRTLQLTEVGQELYRAADEALAVIDAATQRVIGRRRTLAVTSSVPMASLWLGPRLPAFNRVHPEIDMQVTASNDVLDLQREQIDIAIRYVAHGATAPSREKLFEFEMFPVCSPALARDRARPIRTSADLSRHVLLDLHAVRNGRAWHDWRQWFDAVNIRNLKAAGSLRFSHYEQVVQAAIEGSGVAIGKLPHLARHLRDGTLVAPLGSQSIARLGSLYAVVSERADCDIADRFVNWLHSEAQKDATIADQLTAPVRSRRPNRATPPRNGKR